MFNCFNFGLLAVNHKILDFRVAGISQKPSRRARLLPVFNLDWLAIWEADGSHQISALTGWAAAISVTSGWSHFQVIVRSTHGKQPQLAHRVRIIVIYEVCEHANRSIYCPSCIPSPLSVRWDCFQTCSSRLWRQTGQNSQEYRMHSLVYSFRLAVRHVFALLCG